MIPFSPLMFPDAVTLHRSTPTTDAMGASRRSPSPTGEPFAASVQLGQPSRTNADGRTFAATPTVVFTPTDPAAKPDDEFRWTDHGGVSRVLPVESHSKPRGIGGVTWSTVCKETV